MPRRKVTPEMVEMMEYMEREGESVAEIADKLNLPRKTVLRYLEEGKVFKKIKGKMSQR